MTQSDFEFIDQLVGNRFVNPPQRSGPLTAFASWYCVLAAGALLAGAAIGLVT
jgi:hypothetical protein